VISFENYLIHNDFKNIRFITQLYNLYIY